MTDTFQWERDSGAGFVDIGGATNPTYVQVSGDVGKMLRVRGYRDAVLVGESPAIGPIASASTDTYTPNKTFAGGSGTNIDAFLASLVPGDVAGLSGICLIGSPIRSNAGASGHPIVITSNDFGSPATLRGRLDMRGGASWWTFDYLYMDDTQTSQPTSWVIGANNCKFRRLSCTNHNTHIGWDFLNDTTYGQSHDNLIEQCRIYNIGPVAFDNRSHGIYNQGVNNSILDNLIYGCSSRAVQLRGGHTSTVKFNTGSDNGCGVMFGDLGAVGNQVSKNIWAHRRASGRYLVEAYDPLNVNSGNVFDDNFVFDGGLQPGLSGVAVSNTHTADPLFTDRAGHVYTLAGGSPAAGYGPRTFCPLGER